jgi:AcrR family transcriptional regulator
MGQLMPVRSSMRLADATVDSYVGLDDDAFWATVESPVLRRLIEAALECFASRGYHGTTTREVAERGGVSPGGVYVHFASKSDMLFTIALWGHHSSLAVIEDALRRTDADDHERRLRAIISALVTWHVEHLELARVIAFEQGALPPERRLLLRPFRHRFFEHVAGELVAGHEDGEFDVVNPTDTARVLLSLCSDIARWYRPGRGPGSAKLASDYADIATRLVK